MKYAMREKCPNTEFFLVRIQETMGQKNPVFGHFSRSYDSKKNKTLVLIPLT